MPGRGGDDGVITVGMPPVPVTSLYAVAIAVLAIGLAARVIVLRRRHRVALGTGDNPALAGAIRGHGNLTEHGTLALVLMVILELNGGPRWALHTTGGTLLVGRCIHAWALGTRSLGARTIGMALTFTAEVLLVVALLQTLAR